VGFTRMMVHEFAGQKCSTKKVGGWQLKGKRVGGALAYVDKEEGVRVGV